MGQGKTPLSFNDGIGFGDNVDYYSVLKFGLNPDIDTADAPEDVWAGGGVYSGFPTGSPETVEIFSDDADDTSAGAGARTVRIFGLKSATSTTYESEDLTLNGVTPVVSTNTWYRVNRATVLTAGATGANEGTLVVRHTTTTTNVFVSILPLYNQSSVCAWTVPYGKTAILSGVNCNMVRSAGNSGSANGTLRIRPSGGVFNAVLNFEISDAQAFVSTFSYPILLNSLDDIKVSIDVASDDNTIVSSFLEILVRI